MENFSRNVDANVGGGGVSLSQLVNKVLQAQTSF